MYAPFIVYNSLFRPTNAQYINNNAYFVQVYDDMILLLILCAHFAKNSITALTKVHEYFSEKSGFFVLSTNLYLLV